MKFHKVLLKLIELTDFKDVLKELSTETIKEGLIKHLSKAKSNRSEDRLETSLVDELSWSFNLRFLTFKVAAIEGNK